MSESDDTSPDRRNLWVKYLQLGIQFGATVALFAGLGFWIEQHLEIEPWGTLTGAFLGVLSAGYLLLKEFL